MKNLDVIDYSKEAGGAVVETAILMIIFVPLLLYAFSAGEMSMSLLEAQEEVVAATWDVSTFPFTLLKTSSGSITDMCNMAREQYATGAKYRRNAFVKGSYSQQLQCIKTSSNIGSFSEGRSASGKTSTDFGSVYKNGIAALQGNAAGGVVEIGTKVLLKNRLVPTKFRTMSLKVPNITISNRFFILADSWGLFELEDDYTNSRLSYAPDTFFDTSYPSRTYFQAVTNEVRNSAKFINHLRPILKFKQTAKNEAVADITVFLDQRSVGSTTARADLAKPNIMDLYMVTCAPGGGTCGSIIRDFWNGRWGTDKLKSYKYVPTLETDSMIGTIIRGLTLGFLDLRPQPYTTPLYNDSSSLWQRFIAWITGRPRPSGLKYKTAFENRTKYYMAGRSHASAR